MGAGEGKGSTLRLALCIGGTTSDVAALDREDRFIAELSLSTHTGGALMEAGKAAADRIAFTRDHWKEFLDHRMRLLDELGRSVSTLSAGLAMKDFRISGLGVSAPGAIHPRTGEVQGALGALNLPAWGNFNLRKALGERTNLAVHAVNDAKAMALGALARITRDVVRILPGTGENGGGKEAPLGEEGLAVRDFIEIDPGTGLGGAYVVDRKLWFGPDESEPDPDVGEIWKIEADPDQPGIPFEELASGRAMLARLKSALAAAAPEEGDELISRSGGRIQEMLRIARPVSLELIRQELERTGRYLGLGICCLMTRERARLGAPDIRSFLIGGGPVGGRSPEAGLVRRLLHGAIERELGDSVPPHRIFFSVLGGRAGVYGSAALVPDRGDQA